MKIKRGVGSTTGTNFVVFLAALFLLVRVSLPFAVRQHPLGPDHVVAHAQTNQQQDEDPVASG